VKIPYVEVHISNIYERGIHSVIGSSARGVIMGLGINGYFLGLDAALLLMAEKRKES
jgi:3-dehydroquinate dehydratase